MMNTIQHSNNNTNISFAHTVHVYLGSSPFLNTDILKAVSLFLPTP